MTDRMQYGENDPRHHTAKLKQMLRDVAAHVTKVSDPKAQALFETTTEVLLGLEKAYQDFEDRNERAWKGAAG